MKHSIQIAAVLLILLSAALLVPAASAYLAQIATASLLVAVVLLIASLAGGRLEQPAAKPAVAEAVKPAALPAVAKNQGQAEVITLLGVFQDKGRLVDFLMDDITPFNDEQVGSVVRAVHQGCKAALME